MNSTMEILIVDDDFITRSLLKKMLFEMGHQVVEAENGMQAWELLQKRHIQLVISDWVMPEMDGVELCRNIRNEVFPGYTYVIMITAKDRKKDLVEVFSSGADDYIPKPLEVEEIRARVLTGLRVIDFEQRHKRMAENLIESRNKLRVVIDALQEEIVAVDMNYQIVAANRSFARHAGSTIEKIVGTNCMDLAETGLQKYCFDSVKPMVKAVLASGKSQDICHHILDEQGYSVYKKTACIPISKENGKVSQVLVVIKDITEDRQKSEKIRSLNDQLILSAEQLETKNKRLKTAMARLEETQAHMLQTEKMASIGQLSAGVAHEINNPTGFVRSNLKTLDDYQKDIVALIKKYQELAGEVRSGLTAGMDTNQIENLLSDIASFENEIEIGDILEDISDLINDCLEGTERIKKIVYDLKDFAHPGEDNLQSIDINKGLISTLNVVNNEIKYKADLETDLGDIQTVRGYPQQLNQVFMNILVNAAQAMNEKGRIRVVTRQEGDDVVVAISDTGCGIAPENLNKIFDPFYTTKEVGKGTGLGMNIAYNIIKKHHGTIQVDSELCRGTTFTIRIPSMDD